MLQVSTEEEVHPEDEGIDWTPWWGRIGGGIGGENEIVPWTEI